MRFVYVRPRDWYLSFNIERKRDVIERPVVDDIDCNGWDLRKALHLFSRTNGALLEWLNSPIRYIERGDFAMSLRQLAAMHFNATALCYHYSHMARSNYRECLTGNRVRLKKYLYVLRPLLAIRHIEQELGIPPVRFESLVDAVAPVEIRPNIAGLLAAKRPHPNWERASRFPNSTVSSNQNLTATAKLSRGSGDRTCWILQSWKSG